MDKEKGSTLKDLLLVAGGVLGAEAVRHLAGQANKENPSSEAMEGMARILKFPDPDVRDSLLQFISGIPQSSVKAKFLSGLNTMDDETLKALAKSPEAQKQLLEMMQSDIQHAFSNFRKRIPGMIQKVDSWWGKMAKKIEESARKK